MGSIPRGIGMTYSAGEGGEGLYCGVLPEAHGGGNGRGPERDDK